MAYVLADHIGNAGLWILASSFSIHYGGEIPKRSVGTVEVVLNGPKCALSKSAGSAILRGWHGSNCTKAFPFELTTK